MKFVSLIFCGALILEPLSGQQPAPGAASASVPLPAGVTCPTKYAAGATYGPEASPKVTGFGAVITLLPGLTCDPTKEQPHSYSQYIETPVKVNGVWTLQQTISTGIAISSSVGGNYKVWLLGTAGTTVTGATSTVKLGTTVGLVGTIPIGKTKVTLLPGFELVNGNKTGILGVMF